MDTTKPATSGDVRRSEELVERYANHVSFEMSVWDLKLIFGQLDQQLGPQTVIQHTAMTLPWPQVKILHHILGSNLVVHEMLNGRVRVPPGIVPNPTALKE